MDDLLNIILDRESYQIETESTAKNPLVAHYTSFKTYDQASFRTLDNFIQSISPKLTSLEDLLKEVNHVPNCYHVCGKVISAGDTIYHCIDCSRDKANLEKYVQCKDCFSLSKHQGHRTTKKEVKGLAVCDCGDSSAWDPEGSCKNHLEYSKETKKKTLLETPAEIRQGFLTSLTEIFEWLFCHLDCDQLGKNSIFFNIISIMRCLAGKNDCFKRLCVEFLKSKAPKSCMIRPTRSFNLNCYPFEGGEYSFVELLAGWDKLFTSKVQREIRFLLTELFVDQEFKEFYSELYPKLLDLYCYNVSPTHNSLFSESANLYSFLFSDRECATLAASSKEATSFLKVIKKSICCQRTATMEKTRIACWTACMNLKCLIQNQEQAELFINHPDFVSALFDLIDEGDKFEQPESISEFLSKFERGNYSSELQRKTLAFSYILDVLETLFARLFNLSNPEFRTTTIETIFKEFLKRYQSRVNAVLDPDSFSILPLLQDSFGLFMLMWFRHTGSLEKFVEQVQAAAELLTIEQDAFQQILEKIFQQTLSTVMQTLTLQRIKRFRRYSYIINSLQDYMQHRMAPRYLIGSTEVCLVQLLSVFDQKQEWVPRLADIILKQALSCPESPTILIMFFESIEFIFSDIIAPLNVLRSQNSKGIKESMECEALLCKIERRVLLNFFHAMPLSTYDSLQKLKFLINFESLDGCLKEIASFDQSTNKIRLKEAFKNKEMTPDLFFSNLEFHELLTNKSNEFSLKASNSKELELLNPFTQKMEFVKILPHAALFAKNFIEFGNESQAKQLRWLLPFFDRQLENLRNTPKILKKQILETKIWGEYIRKHELPFGGDVFGIYTCKPKNDLGVLLAYVEKIESGNEGSNQKGSLSAKFAEILKATYDEEEEEKTNQVEEEKASNDAALPGKGNNMKEMILAKQRALREKMLMKGAKVIEQQAKEDQEEKKVPEEEEVQNCAFCHEVIDINGEKLYGTLCSIYSSNYYSSCLKNSHPTKQIQSKSVLTIDTCNHLFHSQCVEKLRERKHMLYYNEYTSESDVKCPLCKQFSNMFLPSIQKQPSCNLNKSEFEFSFEFLVSKVQGQYKSYTFFEEDEKFSLSTQSSASESKLFDELGIAMALKSAQDQNSEIAQDLEMGAQAAQILINNILMTELLGVKLFIEKKLDITLSIARALKTRCWRSAPTPEWLWDQHDENLAFLSIHSSNASFDELLHVFGLDSQISYFKLILTTYLLDTPGAEQGNNLKEFFQRVLLINLVLQMLNDFLQRIASEKKANLRAIRCELIFENFINSLPELILCGNSSVGTLLRKYLCFGLSLDLYDQRCLKPEAISDTEEFMIKTLFGLADEEAFIPNVTSFLKSNELFFCDIIAQVATDSSLIGKLEETRPLQAIIPLESNYWDLRNRYEDARCTRCQSVSKAGLAICLLCGEIRCMNKCDSSDSSTCSYHFVGNMHNHARSAHHKVCAIMELNSGAVILINSPQNAYKNHLYMSSLGQLVDSKKTNWKEFVLSKPALDKIRKILVLERISEEIRHITRVCERSIRDNYY